MYNKLSDAIRAANQKSFLRKSVALTGSAATLALMGFTTQVMAEEAAPTEEVVVTGIRGSLKAAVDIKRAADAAVDAISAEDVGKFPDKNLAESLQRVPGVTINRGFTGEGNEVSIRGVNPQLTSVELNGQYVASTGWFSQSANKRSFNMDLMPSEMVKKVSVYKSPTASLDEGGIGGTVIVETRKPLELEANTGFGSIEGNNNTVESGKVGAGFGGMYSWKNDSETFGILGAISSVTTIGRAAKAENYWEEGWSASGVSYFTQDRKRDAYDITAQLKPTDELTFTAHLFQTKIDATNTNQNFLTINSHWRDGVTNQGNFTNVGGRMTPAGIPTIGTTNSGAWLAQDINSRQAEIKSNVYDLNTEYKGEGYTLTLDIGATKADGGNGGNINTLWGVGGYAIDWAAPGAPGHNVPFVNPVTGAPITVDVNMDGTSKMQMRINGADPADGKWQQLGDGPSRGVTILGDKESYGQLDGLFDVELGSINAIKTGVKVRAHEFENSLQTWKYNGTAFAGTSLADWQDGVIDQGGAGTFGGTFTKIARLDYKKVQNEVLSHEARTALAGEIFGEKQAYADVQEDDTALYTQADFKGEGYSGNIGLRYVSTDVTATRYSDQALFVTVTDFSKTDEKNTYSDWLPSANLKLDLSDDVVMRISAAKVMSRPGYSEMSPSFTSSAQQSKTATKGNPEIDPYRASQIDAGLEWYFQEGSILSGAIFNKDIASFITTTKKNMIVSDANGAQTYVVSVPTQGRGGVINGIEIQYQQSFGDFGAIVNYTYVDGKGVADDGTKIDLPGTSRNAYNLTGYYENETFSVRAAYTHRSEFLAEGLGIGGTSLFDPQTFLDLSAVYHVTSNIDLTLEGVNVLDEQTVQLHGGGLKTFNLVNENGTRYNAKVSFKF